jgi:pantoate--beta-alanine ligase
MKIVSDAPALRAQLADWRRQGQRIALVPTMGNLHEGHLSLVRMARSHAERVVVTIFVNPTQFVKGEDFDRYPRTPERDATMLRDEATDLLFLPSVATMYPRGLDETTRVQVPSLDAILCGEFRPGHFTGVATVVTKLFNLVQPDVAVFGDKDFQQLLLIRWMVEDLCLPIEIVGVPTVREPDGLAKSSRNGYLSDGERHSAPMLYQTLKAAAESAASGVVDLARVELEAMTRLRESGFEPQYVAIRSAADLGTPADGEVGLVILAAAYLGKTRLIDHLSFERSLR